MYSHSASELRDTLMNFMTGKCHGSMHTFIVMVNGCRI